MDLPYNDYGQWLKKRFHYRVQKLPIDAGFSCPNRDGSISFGGCTFCNNQSFSPPYCKRGHSVAQQIEEGKKFFGRKSHDMKYLVYFQSYTNTYADVKTLMSIYEEALRQADVVGIVIATRPDCISEALLAALTDLNRRTLVIVEYGIESADNATLLRINRGHTFEQSVAAVNETHRRGILVGGHVILGLPGESPDDSLRQAPLISALPLDFLKIHQLQVIRGTKLAIEYEANPFHLYSLDEYVELVSQYILKLRKDIVIERFASQVPASLLIAPRWGVKQQEVTERVICRLKSFSALSQCCQHD